MSKRAAHYTVRIADDICMHVAMGESLEGALKKVGYLAPTLPTVYKWLTLYEEFKEKYDIARQMQADTLADKTLDMAQQVLKDPKSAAAYRVAFDILQWHSSIRKPKVYNTKNADGKTEAPLNAEKIKSEITRLQKELGVVEKKVVPMKAVSNGAPAAKPEPKADE